MMADHRRGTVTNNFCTVAGRPCECGNDYYKACEGEAKKWEEENAATYPQKYTVRDEVTELIKELKKNTRSFEAHHILPVACVTEVISTWDEKYNTNPSVVTGTKWCINREVNMIAMPMWGHTIMWYTNNFAGLTKEVQQEIKQQNEASKGMADPAPISDKARKAISKLITDRGDTAPPFKDIPQHNYSHTGKTRNTGYNQEIVFRLTQMRFRIKTAKNKHQTDKINDIKEALDNLSKSMRTQLNNRATTLRTYQSTHEAWKGGMKGKKNDSNSEDWYKNFSMAQKPPSMDFPLGRIGGSMAQKIADLARAMWMPDG